MEEGRRARWGVGVVWGLRCQGGLGCARAGWLVLLLVAGLVAACSGGGWERV